MPANPPVQPAAFALAALCGLILAAGCGTSTRNTSAEHTRPPAVTTLTTPSASPSASVSPSRAPTPTVRTATLRRSGTSPTYTVTVRYPQLSGLSNVAAQAEINGDVQTAVTRIVDQFVADTKQAAGDWTPPPGTPTAGLQGQFDTVRLDARLASFRLTYAPYAAGAAHPTDLVATFTYDLRTGHRYRLAELFHPGADYLSVLSQDSRRLLMATYQGLDPQQVADGTKPTADNFAAWTLTDTGLQVTFEDYQVGPHAIGTPSITIPTAALQPIAAPDGPLLSG